MERRIEQFTRGNRKDKTNKSKTINRCMLVGVGVRVNSKLWRGGNRQNLYNLHLSVQQAFLAPEVEYAVELRATARFRDWPLGAPLPGLYDGQQQG